jgi:ketosteroid isomerase-like protein
MSQENVELLRRIFDAYTRRDLDAVLALYDLDVEIAPVMGPAFTTYHGHDGTRTFWNDVFSAFPDFSAEVLEARDLGDLVLGTVCIRGHGAGSDVPAEQTVWYVSEWRDGKLLWYRAYESESEALAAAARRE